MRDWFYTCNNYLFLSLFLQREFVMIILLETYSNLVPGLLMRLTYSFWTFPVVFPASLLCFGSYTMEIYPYPKPARKSMAGSSIYKNILSCHHCCVLQSQMHLILYNQNVLFWLHLALKKHFEGSQNTIIQIIPLRMCELHNILRSNSVI